MELTAQGSFKLQLAGKTHVLDANPICLSYLITVWYFLPVQVLRLVGAPHGAIASGQSAGLNFVFSPVEAKEYSISLPIKLGNGIKDALTVMGKGFHPLSAAAQSALADPSAATVSVPAGTAGDSSSPMLRTLWQSQVQQNADKATWPGFSAASSQQAQQQQLLVLSHGVLSFGPVSIKRHSKRIVALTAGPQHGAEFEWDLGMLGCDGCLDGQLDIQPANGKLAPNECCLCKMTFTAGFNPQLFQGAIQCRAVALPQSAAPVQAASLALASLDSVVVHSSQSAAVQPQGSPTAPRAGMRRNSNSAQSMPGMTGNSRQSLQVPSSPGAVAKAAPANAALQSTSGRSALTKQGSAGRDGNSRQNSLHSPSRGKAPTSPLSPSLRQTSVSSQHRTPISSQNRTQVSRSLAGNSPQGHVPAGPAPLRTSPSKVTSRSAATSSSPRAELKAKQSPARISSITNLPARSLSQSPSKAKQEPGVVRQQTLLCSSVLLATVFTLLMGMQ